MENKIVGERIKELRIAEGRSREGLAEEAEISAKFLYEIEIGKKNISAGTLLRLAKALSCSCDYIMTGEKEGTEKRSEVSRILNSMKKEQLEKVEEVVSLIGKI